MYSLSGRSRRYVSMRYFHPALHTLTQPLDILMNSLISGVFTFTLLSQMTGSSWPEGEGDWSRARASHHDGKAKDWTSSTLPNTSTSGWKSIRFDIVCYTEMRVSQSNPRDAHEDTLCRPKTPMPSFYNHPSISQCAPLNYRAVYGSPNLGSITSLAPW